MENCWARLKAGAANKAYFAGHGARAGVNGSSRTHVIKLLNDATADGLVDRSSGNGIVLLPRLSEAVHEFFAIGYVFLAHCAKAIREGHVAAP